MKPFHNLHKRIKQEEIKDMNLKDYFAAKAMQGMLAYPNVGIDPAKLKSYSIAAYKMADAMMEARNV